MRKTIFAIIVLSLMNTDYSFSQLPNQNMTILGNLNEHFTSTLYSAIWGYTASDGREYALLGCPGGTAFIDVTDSANIHEVDFQTGPTSSWREMKTYSHYAYIVSEGQNSQLQIIDLQYLPDSVHFVKKFVAPLHTTTHSISQSGPYLFLNGCNSAFVANGGIVVFDLSIDPETPVVRGKWTSLYVHDCRVVNDTIYAANINDGKVSIINATNKSSLSLIKSFENLPGAGPHNTALSHDRKRLFVTDEIGTAPHLLKIWNIEDISDITYVTNWQPTGITTSIVHNVETYGNYALIAHYSAGVRVIDISNPDNPTEVAWYDTYPSNNNESYNGCWGVYMFPSEKIIASDRQTGLYVLKVNINIFQKPKLIHPINNSYNNPLNINFKWNKLNSAKSYILSVSEDSLFNDIIVNDTLFLDTTGIVNGLHKGTKYFWKVQAIDSIKNISTSEVWKFTTIPPIQSNIKLLFEGLYYASFNQLIRGDSVNCYLRLSTSPYNLIDSSKAKIDSITFSGLFKFFNALSGNYYISVKHLNTIETWSKSGGENLANDGSIYHYDFTNANTQARKQLKIKRKQVLSFQRGPESRWIY